MKTDWWKHLPTNQQAERKETVERSKLMREATLDVVQQKLKDLEKLQESKSNYESPAWPMLQADYIGYRRALHEMIDLLTIEKD